MGDEASFSVVRLDAGCLDCQPNVGPDHHSHPTARCGTVDQDRDEYAERERALPDRG